MNSYTTSTPNPAQQWTVISENKVYRIAAATEAKVRSAFAEAGLAISALYKDEDFA